MKNILGVIFLVASLATGLTGLNVWREMGEHDTGMILMPGFALVSLFFLIVGVQLMLGKNPFKKIWRGFLDDE